MVLPQRTRVAIFWFRRDIRLEDNTALYHALCGPVPVLPIFIFDPEETKYFQKPYDSRMEFLYRTLGNVHQELQQRGKGILVLSGNPCDIIQQLTEQYDVHAVYANEEYEPYARMRDTRIEQILAERGACLFLYKDSVIRAKSELLTATKTPYRVFTAYRNAWRSSLAEDDIREWSSVVLLGNFVSVTETPIPTLESLGFKCRENIFTVFRTDEGFLREYVAKRNIPALDATSHVGVYLRYGTLSIRSLVKLARCSDTWLDELLWREFFAMLLFHFPHVVHAPYKPLYAALPWRNNEEEFARWCQGTTGYPLVDAGMRQLNTTGWMHNRVRMVAASFLVKHLLIDWRWGEAYFASLLVDYDLASNNGNWQWVAGTGCDAAPYFRIFHPEKQREKFDPEYLYCRRWVPELDTPLYPAPIVEHHTARERALQIYRSVGGEAKKNTNGNMS